MREALQRSQTKFTTTVNDIEEAKSFLENNPQVEEVTFWTDQKQKRKLVRIDLKRSFIPKKEIAVVNCCYGLYHGN